MSKNNAGSAKPRMSTTGQSTHCASHSGKTMGVVGQAVSSNNKPAHASPRHGVTGQRLAGGGGKGATGYPPGYTSR